MYEWVSVRFVMKYVPTSKPKKNVQVGRAYFHKKDSKQRKCSVEADNRLCCDPKSVTTWFVPLGHFCEQSDIGIRLANTAPLNCRTADH